MKIDKNTFQRLKNAPNSAYDLIKPYFLFHSNKLEGSTFSEEEIIKLVDSKEITGKHSVNDVYETLNSLSVFDYVINSLGEKISHESLIDMNTQLLANTTIDLDGFTGSYKKGPTELLAVTLRCLYRKMFIKE